MSSAIVGDKSHLPIHQRRTRDSKFDRIWKYYYLTDKQVQLTKKEEELRKRWELAWMMDCSLLSKQKIARRISKRFDISERQGFKDVQMARLLFSDPTQNNKDAQRAIMSNLIELLIKKAVANKDFKAAEKLILRYDKINGLSAERENPVAEFMQRQKPVAIVFNSDPETLKKQAEELMQDVQDVDHVEIDAPET